MTDVDKWERSKAQTIAKDDQWHTLKIDDDDSLSLATGPVTYLAHSAVTVSGLPAGQTAGLRFGRVYDYPDDKPTTIEGWYPVTELIGTSGSAFGAISWPNNLTDKAPSNGKERLRLFINCGSAAVTVEKITSRCLHD